MTDTFEWKENEDERGKGKGSEKGGRNGKEEKKRRG
jgi:hypothetical protein